ncbi:MAG: hypothetical protein P9C36_08745 [Defluviicoccus sp.]|nr:hypothetical protein [Defluviicoccus sp.]MDG4592694.1 hypothetical protein [Defluviicoccus sp.]MDS4010172.1 hypothetical protein [Defluviicoccus sp.]MDS4074069.1 hypothetical protein [Defluviicoccus sp.]
MSRLTQRSLPAVLGGTLLSLFLISSPEGARAQGVGAVVPLPADMRAAGEKYLPGVIGDPVPAFTIDPSLATLSAGTRTYAVVSGNTDNNTEQHKITASDKPGQWRYTVGNRTVFLHEAKGESLSIVSEQDNDKGVLTRYSPAQPLLIAGMNAGDEKTMTLKVNVYDLDDPDDLEHSGTLDLTLTYVGAYKVTVPAGTFDAAMLRWTYKGKVGPASVDDIQVRFIAKDVGMVAAAEKLDVAAFLVYNDNSKVGKVLQQK